MLRPLKTPLLPSPACLSPLYGSQESAVSQPFEPQANVKGSDKAITAFHNCRAGIFNSGDWETIDSAP
ncbi:hypothetical protein SKAU_G00373660 [Synaphobranchus kaupii]|uniref:Uncharacterized protein n=1 Tax=Synaphobranchus kaupii TaxID=118154 RepID=A0A9Q1IF93_SYNKA|nr:hypothetical protein SKAU_G00373660 [Synaphobranchus kaupii]